MSKYRRVCLYLVVAGMLAAAGCTGRSAEITELKRYPISDLNGLITRSGVELDSAITADGNGAFRIRADQPMTIRLYETGDIDIEEARLIYRAKIRSEEVSGKVYLEMWCQFTGKGDFFSRALHSPITGTNEWSTQETPFFLQPGQNPENVKLNLVIEGTGTVWIDDIRLVRGPLS
jgi:hypothetical protein